MTTILVTGATGFVGRSIVKALRGHQVRALVRSTSSHLPDGVAPVVGDVTAPSTLETAAVGVDVLIHLVGIIEERGSATFDRIIYEGSKNIVDAAKSAGVRHLILMSALGARDEANLPYMQAKYRSEEYLKASGLPYTIFRPSVIFGPGDGFVTTLATVVRKFPVIPVVGSGATRFSPVAIEDIADAFCAVVNDPSLARNATIEAGGAQTLTYEAMLDMLAAELGVRKPKVHVPLRLMQSIVKVSTPLPKALKPPVTPEQLKMLSLDNSTPPSSLASLIGRSPKSLEGNISYIRS
jgi:NADH dehydrogenase